MDSSGQITISIGESALLENDLANYRKNRRKEAD
jgi:hypothetical protein